MDHFDALELAKYNRVEGDAIHQHKHEYLLPAMIRWFYMGRYLAPREYEDTASAIRMKAAFRGPWRRQVVEKLHTPDYRINYYAERFKPEDPSRVPESTATEELQYEPLPSSRHIRLISMPRAEKDSPIDCSMTAHSLENVPPYVALSYTWGSSTTKLKVTCNGKSLPVTENLFHTLQHIRLYNDLLYIWVDAICINQKDAEERESQVRMMGQIYRTANVVWVWLGLTNPRAQEAMYLIRHIREVQSKFEGNPLSFRELVEAGIPDTHWTSWISLESLLWRSWFTRVWVIQELCLSRDAVLISGNDSISPNDLFSVVTFISQSAIQTATGIHLGSSPYLAKLHRSCAENQSRSLFALLLDTRAYHATDPRDKIYGLLGLCDTPENITVDYGKPVSQVYTDLAVQYLRSGTLDVLTAVSDPFWRLQDDLPSWAPDWSTVPRVTELLRPGKETIALATGDSTATVQYTDNGRVLILEGIFLDDIKSTYKPFIFRSTMDILNGGYRLSPLAKPLAKGSGITTLLRTGLRLTCWEQEALKLKSLPSRELLFRRFVNTITAGAFETENESIDLVARYQTFCTVHLFKERTRKLTTKALEEGTSFSAALYRASSGRTFFTTKLGDIGLGPYSIRGGDRLALLKGGKTPYILRKRKGGQYALVGECYVHDIMNGQAYDRVSNLETIHII